MAYKRKVVYVLGAGFSAPLGLPLVSNFYEVSRDMYNSDRDKYKNFERVFAERGKLNSILNYYNSNLFNIEEILSILEMRAHLDQAAEPERKAFSDYIKCVIRDKTPPIRGEQGPLPGNWYDVVFGADMWRVYGYFVINLFNLTLRRATSGVDHESSETDAEYSIITLNYDSVLESPIEYLNKRFAWTTKILFRTSPTDSGCAPYLCKLHGSVDEEVIMLPTWNKLIHSSILDTWVLARRILNEAREIRIIGYSLPAADAYVKYLLKAACVNAEDLAAIDILCLDPDSQVKRRFKELFSFQKVRYVNGTIEGYLNTMFGLMSRPTGDFRFLQLEQAHRQIFKSAVSIYE